MDDREEASIKWEKSGRKDQFGNRLTSFIPLSQNMTLFSFVRKEGNEIMLNNFLGNKRNDITKEQINIVLRV